MKMSDTFGGVDQQLLKHGLLVGEAVEVDEAGGEEVLHTLVVLLLLLLLLLDGVDDGGSGYG